MTDAPSKRVLCLGCSRTLGPQDIESQSPGVTKWKTCCEGFGIQTVIGDRLPEAPPAGKKKSFRKVYWER